MDPLISVCMPYYNGANGVDRQTLLDRALERYGELYEGLEISICDDGSPEPVKAPGCKVTTLPKKDKALNPCVPINAAVNASTCDIVVLTNPEIEHRESVFLRMMAAVEDGDSYVTAACRNPDGRWLAHSSVDWRGSRLRAPIPPGSQFHFCAMFRRELWERAGGFDEDYRLGQAFDDNDWLWRLYSVGAEFKQLDDCVVHHHPTRTAWPSGGWQVNAALLMGKWGTTWGPLIGDHGTD